MNMVKAKCGCYVPAVGFAGSLARLRAEQSICGKPGCPSGIRVDCPECRGAGIFEVFRTGAYQSTTEVCKKCGGDGCVVVPK